jgi:hypothetical protein
MTIEDDLIEDICRAMDRRKATVSQGNVALCAVLISSMKNAGFSKKDVLEWIDEGWSHVDLRMKGKN